MKWMAFVAVVMFSVLSSAQVLQKRNAPPRSDQSQAQQSGDSSSKDNKIDLSPPKGDDVKHADADEEDTSDVMETKPWNPHKAAKDIEVGDFYAKRKNFRAAISRYREALEYKPKDAEATFKLAQALEATKQSEEALQRYQEYLKILPKGDYASDSQKAIERLKAAKSRAGVLRKTEADPSALFFRWREREKMTSVRDDGVQIELVDWANPRHYLFFNVHELSGGRIDDGVQF